MAKPGLWDIAALCPFYCRTEKQKHRILCEGITTDSRLSLVFTGSDEARVNHLKRYCCAEYEKCALYHAIYRQYESEQK